MSAHLLAQERSHWTFQRRFLEDCSGRLQPPAFYNILEYFKVQSPTCPFCMCPSSLCRETSPPSRSRSFLCLSTSPEDTIYLDSFLISFTRGTILHCLETHNCVLPGIKQFETINQEDYKLVWNGQCSCWSRPCHTCVHGIHCTSRPQPSLQSSFWPLGKS